MKYIKSLVLLSLILIISSIIFPACIVVAETPSNVLDCFEGDDDCFESKEESLKLNDGKENTEQISQSQTDSTLINVIKMFFALAFVLVLLYVVVKVLGGRQKLNRHVKSLENIGGISVGNNKSVQLVRVGHTFYLIGVGDDVQLLQEIKDEQVIKALLSEEDEEELSISDYLISLFNKQKNKKDDSKATFEEYFSKQLNKANAERRKVINHYTEKEDEHE